MAGDTWKNAWLGSGRNEFRGEHVKQDEPTEEVSGSQY